MSYTTEELWTIWHNEQQYANEVGLGDWASLYTPKATADAQEILSSLRSLRGASLARLCVKQMKLGIDK